MTSGINGTNDSYKNIYNSGADSSKLENPSQRKPAPKNIEQSKETSNVLKFDKDLNNNIQQEQPAPSIDTSSQATEEKAEKNDAVDNLNNIFNGIKNTISLEELASYLSKNDDDHFLVGR